MKFNTVDEYVETFPKEVREKLNLLRMEIKKIAPKAEDCFSYGVPAFKLKKVFIVYAAFKNHIGLYPTPSTIKYFSKELEQYETAEGTIKFPLKEELPLALIKRIVKYRIKEIS